MVVDALRGKMGKFFSENQISAVLSGKKRVNWTSDDIARALTLRYLGIRSYVYLRQNLGIPLPGIVHRNYPLPTR